MPDDCCTGFIIPLYKGKGSKDDVNNYRGTTILSCSGKLFTGAINHRLKEFLDRLNVIGPEQAGFKKDHSTLDHIFVLKTVIDIYLSNKKRLYACFVDYEKAFDKVDTPQLWIKLLNSNISGKMYIIFMLRLNHVFLLLANYLIHFLVKSGLDRVIAYHLFYLLFIYQI